MSLYPFTAIVDQERLVQALLVNAVNPAVGGVLVEGPSGTGKSTAVRGLAELLPEIEVVADCPFSCDPADPCASCRERVERGEQLGTHRRRVRVVDLPLNATEDRVAGSVDIARALREGVMALEPGLLAEANRGIVYVDEINLLDDHICDVLLDAAALGVNVVEREGVSVSHPARFLLVGTMNPEEGELRPQLADRIGLRVVVEALSDPGRRAEVIRRREAYTADPAGFAAAWVDEHVAFPAREVAGGEGWTDFLVGRQDDMYIEAHRVEIAAGQTYRGENATGFTVITLVDGETARIQAPGGGGRSYDANYLDVILVPASMPAFEVVGNPKHPIVIHTTFIRHDRYQTWQTS